MPSSHALLSPSSAKRWMTCIPSARIEAGLEDKETSYAKEGTLAHAFAEWALDDVLRHLDNAPEYGEFMELIGNDIDYSKKFYEFTDKARELQVDIVEMVETVYKYYVVEVFGDYLFAKCQDPDALLLIEAKLNLAPVIPEGFGSSDAIIIHDDKLRVYDLKYGKGVKVDADHNPQMMCYAIGAVLGPGELYDIKEVSMCIMQPRLKHESEFRMSYEDLRYWAFHILAPKALEAFEGAGEFKAGPHCKFCKYAPKCRALYLHSKVIEETYGNIEALTPEEISLALTEVETIKTWAGKIEEYALDSALKGKPIPGWKVVEGRSISKLSDQETAIERLTDKGFDMSVLLKPKELKTITDLKKILRPKGFEDLLGDLVVKPQGKPTLAPESDKRPEFRPETANDDFNQR